MLAAFLLVKWLAEVGAWETRFFLTQGRGGKRVDPSPDRVPKPMCRAMDPDDVRPGCESRVRRSCPGAGTLEWHPVLVNVQKLPARRSAPCSLKRTK